MTRVIFEAINVSGRFVLFASEELFHSEIFVRSFQTSRYSQEIKIALQQNNRFLAVCNFLDLSSQDEKLVTSVLRNIREVFPNGSLQLKKLTIDEFKKDHSEIDLIGLVEICVIFCPSAKNFNSILSIATLEKIVCKNLSSIPQTGNYPGIKILDLDFRKNIFFNADMFPNIEELCLCSEEKIEFRGIFGNLLDFEINVLEKISIDFEQFPNLKNLDISFSSEIPSLQLKNESGQIQKLQFFSREAPVQNSIENCSFSGLRLLYFDFHEPCDDMLQFFINSPISILFLTDLNDISVLKQMKCLKKINLNYSTFEEALELKKLNVETINLYSDEITSEMKILGKPCESYRVSFIKLNHTQ